MNNFILKAKNDFIKSQAFVAVATHKSIHGGAREAHINLDNLFNIALKLVRGGGRQRQSC